MSHHPRIAAWLTREDYPAVKRLSPRDRTLPDSFAQWLEIATKQVAELEANGIPVQKVVIDSVEIAAYCRDCGINADSPVRDAVAIKKARG